MDITDKIDLLLGEGKSAEEHSWEILDVISTTNNGKLMLKNLTKEQMKWVSFMKQQGYIRTSTFMTQGDAIVWTDKGVKRWNPKAKNKGY